MLYLIVAVLIVAVVVLWRRVDALERRLAGSDEAMAPVAATQILPGMQEGQPKSISHAMPAEPAEVAPDKTPRWTASFDFEDLFGRLLPIWAGGVTLAVAGFFLVRWSIDRGLLTPGVRVLLAGLFGVVLLGGAEVAYRWRERVADPRVAQALAGAGLATLYAAFYLAGSAYGLIGSTLAFVGLALVTAAAIGLSFRFGLPSAVLGLVGGFAAPALVGSEEANLPLLTLYLALVTAGLSFTGKRQSREWLGIAALAGGLGWGALLLANGMERTPDAVVLGSYLVLLGAIVPAVAGGSSGEQTTRFMRIGAAAIASMQLAALVQQGGFGGLEWGLYLLLGAALAWFGWREPALREASALAAAVGAALTLFWPDPVPVRFATVATALAAIFGAVPLAQVWRRRGTSLDIGQVAGVALVLGLSALAHFGALMPDGPEPAMALSLLILSLLPAAAAWRGATSSAAEAVSRSSLIAAQAASALLIYGALAQVLPADLLAWTGAFLAVLIVWRARAAGAAGATFALLCALWSVEPIAHWIWFGLLAVGGSPLSVADLPDLREVGLHMVPSVAATGAWAATMRAGRRSVAGVAVALGAIALHVTFRHLFAALAGEDFVVTGVLQRAVWEAILLGAAWVAYGRGWTRVAAGLALAALAHFAWFAVTLHNPLWSEQAVGPLPVANGLLAFYGAGAAALALLRRWSFANPPYLRWAADAALMLVIGLFMLSQLRQAFAGTVLLEPPVGQVEDVLRSVTGIVLAGGFLWWGAHTGSRTWRIGSLVAMVVAVLKVFLVDAAGLEGLARIASFMALGFSLIGIGWFYSRQLRSPQPDGLPTFS